MRVPLDPALGELFLNWKLKSEFNKMDGWVFASPFQAGKNAVSSLGRPATQDQAGGRGSRFGCWPRRHTFRHTYRSHLDETGTPLKVQQELMRHASIGATMNIYGAAMTDTKREADSKVVRMVLGA